MKGVVLLKGVVIYEGRCGLLDARHPWKSTILNNIFDTNLRYITAIVHVHISIA
jgi:hypothetical protein